MDISIMIEGQDGLNWPLWKKIVQAVEELGFAGLYRSDHFTNANPPDKDSLELWVSLTYLAGNTERIRFGQLVSPVSFRHPAFIARQAAALDDLSGGRMILGMGAGWQEREHRLYGFDLGDIPTRMSRLDEALQVVKLLFESDEPVTFKGTHYSLDEATLLPRPARKGGPPLLVGGNGIRRTLPLAAKHADHWNGIYLTPDAFSERSKHLDQVAKDRQVRKSLMTGIYFGANDDALAGRLAPLRKNPNLADKTDTEIVEVLTAHGALAGTESAIKEQLAALAESGVEEIMLQWLQLSDIEGLKKLATTLL